MTSKSGVLTSHGKRLAAFLLRDNNVLGWGIGGKVRHGAATGEAALTIYVEKKVAARDLPESRRFPRTVTTSFGQVPTDVVALGRVVPRRITPRQSTRRPDVYHRPAPLGAEIGVEGGMPGTLGCLVRDNTDDSIQILSAASVLSRGGRLDSGTPIFQPAPPFLFPELEHTIATLTRSTRLQFSPLLYPPRQAVPSNAVDAAIVRPIEPDVVVDETLGGMLPTGYPLHPMVGMIVGIEIRDNGRPVYIANRANAVMSAINVRPLRRDSIAEPTVSSHVAFAGAASGVVTRREVLSVGTDFKVHYASTKGPRLGLLTDVFLIEGDYDVDADIGAAVFTLAGNTVKSRCSGCALAMDLERTYAIPFTEDVSLADKLRDDYLLKTVTGRMLVRLFYKNEAGFRERLEGVSPTQDEVEYARLLHDKYATLAKAKSSSVSWSYVPLTPEVMDDIRATIYGMSRFMTAQEYDAAQSLLDVLEPIVGKSLKEGMEYMDQEDTAEQVLAILQSVPGWDTSYDAL